MAATCVSLAIAGLAAPSAHAGLIVWQKGGEVWIMSDDGSSQRKLFDASNVSGAESLATPSLFPTGKTVTFEANASGGPGTFATAIYRWASGNVLRISPSASGCADCTTRHLAPEVMGATGRVAHQFSSFRQAGQLPIFGGDIRTSSLKGGDEQSFGPACGGPSMPADPSPNPKKPTELAYTGCRDDANQYQLIASEASGAGQRVLDSDDARQQDPAWRPDGERIVVAEGGGSPGLWTYPAGTASDRGLQAVHALQVTFDSSDSPSPHYLGTDRIVFAAQGELWTIPATCQGCSFPFAAKKLTTDGAAAGKEDRSPTWTQQTTLSLFRYNQALQPPKSPNDPYPEDEFDENGDPFLYDETFSEEEFFHEEAFDEAPDAEPAARKPEISRLRLSPSSFRPLSQVGSIGAARRPARGATVSYSLSERAIVTMTVERAQKGRKVGKECVAQTKQNRGRKACTRYRRLKGSFKVPSQEDENELRFTGYLGGKRLKPGRHRLVAVAVDEDDDRSETSRASFKIAR